MKLNNLELPGNLYWENEFAHKSVAQSVDRSVSGRVVVESAALSYGRQIKLTGAWATREQIGALSEMENAGLAVIFTANDNETHSAVFDLEAGGLVAELVGPELNPDSETLYELTINLITVEAV
jgi:predicted alpha/beta superfamily hydrolase